MADAATPLLAVLIDADNTSHKHAGAIFEEIATLGEASVRRIYGDFSSPAMKGWSGAQAGLGIVPHHQPANTVGKNASDIALVIDAMDLLHSGRFDGFVLVSSDSDFTRLAQRIREQGKDVYGIGQKKTPEAFRMACKRFIYIENLGVTEEAPAAEAQARKEPLARGEQLVRNALSDVEDSEGWAELGRVGMQLSQRYPDFDPRSYGHRKLSDLIGATARFEIRSEGNAHYIRLLPKKGKATR
ncbi:NYN domain-containing protein [Halovulum dunhuangense]|uniref:NYN domain-containing protein n=1 Tax=Halovulum dunhuangense TaxID=1505036 RepID=A0A849L4L7_9RHOB|nr:NYN domain-containing protein [Halovulum dunhuangense]NNU81295.1 NYN domain-containing protein [Halovulum dunhuangense]